MSDQQVRTKQSTRVPVMAGVWPYIGYWARGTATGLPVILCHGLNANRYAFDLPGGPSLASFLRQHGRDVWVAELRGSGMSDRPRLFRSDVPYSWDFEDHLHGDVPAILDCVLERTGAPLAHWIGHSMGGMLILPHVAATANPKLASTTVLGSPTDYSATNRGSFKSLLKLRFLVEHLPVSPFPFLVRLAAPLAPWLPAYLFGVFNPINIEPKVARKVAALMAEPVSPSRLWLDFGRFIETGRFGPDTGKLYLEGLERTNVPLLALAGAWDGMAPPESVTGVCRQSGTSAERNCITLGKDTGFKEDYGHVDLVMGLRAETEVFPRILGWLAKYDHSRSDFGRSELVPGRADQPLEPSEGNDRF